MKMLLGNPVCYQEAPCFTFAKAAGMVSGLLSCGRIDLATARKFMSESYGVSVLVSSEKDFVAKLMKIVKIGGY